MATSQRLIKNLYRDSVSLMQFSEKLRGLPGIAQASAVMATENNISLLVEAGLLAAAVPPSPNDLLIVLEGQEAASVSAALEQAEAMLKQKVADPGEGGRGAWPRAVCKWGWNPCLPPTWPSSPPPANTPPPKRARPSTSAYM